MHNYYKDGYNDAMKEWKPRALSAEAELAEAKEDAEVNYLQGMKVALLAFAWWKDGIQYVGTCGTTLTDALAMVEQGKLGGET